VVHDEYKKTTYLGIIECDQLLRVLRFYLKNWSLFTYSVAFPGFRSRRVFSGRGGDY
jgi:hypothetical protein